MWLERRSIFIISLISIHSIYFLLVLLGANWNNPDSMEYLYTAINIREHGIIYNDIYKLPLKGEFFTLRPPVYGIILWLCSFVSESVHFALLIQNITSIFLWIYLSKLLNSFGFQSFTIHLSILAGLVLFPSQLILVNQIMPDMWLEIFFFGAFYHIIRYTQTQHTNRLLCASVFLCAGLLSKPALLFFGVPAGLLYLYIYIRSRNRWVLLYALLLPATACAWSWRNYTITGHYQYSSISNQAMIEANVQSIYLAKYGSERSKFVYDSLYRESDKYTSYKEKSEFIHGFGNKVIMSNLPVFTILYIRSSLNLLLNPGRIDMNIFFNYKPKKEIGLVVDVTDKGWRGAVEYFSQLNIGLYILLSLILVYNLFIVISIGNFLFEKNVLLILRIYLIVSILYICVAAGMFGYARFRLMIYPLMIFTVPFFIKHIAAKLRSKSYSSN